MIPELTTLDTRTHLPVLFQAEGAMRRRCAVVGARLELVSSALVLLEVACHADAALEDLDRLADARGIVLETTGSRLRTWAVSLAGWVGDLWPAAAASGYSAVLAEMRRNVAIATALRRTCLATGDRRMAEWCAMWSEQRTRLAHRLAATLADPAPGSQAPAPSLGEGDAGARGYLT